MTRVLRGEVVSDKADKTVVVAVARVKDHPLYRKKFKITDRYQAHDETNQFKLGDLVEISETRPLSRTKRFEVTRKLSTDELEG